MITALVNCMVIYLIGGRNSCTKTKRRKQLVTEKAIRVLVSEYFSEIISFSCKLLLTFKNLPKNALFNIIRLYNDLAILVYYM